MREFLDEMDRVVPWSALMQIAEPHYAQAETGHPRQALQAAASIRTR